MCQNAALTRTLPHDPPPWTTTGNARTRPASTHAAPAPKSFSNTTRSARCACQAKVDQPLLLLVLLEAACGLTDFTNLCAGPGVPHLRTGQGVREEDAAGNAAATAVATAAAGATPNGRRQRGLHAGARAGAGQCAERHDPDPAGQCPLRTQAARAPDLACCSTSKTLTAAHAARNAWHAFS